MNKEAKYIFEMTNKEASIIIGNIPVYPDDCYSVAEYQWAKSMAIKALEQQPCEDCISRESVIEWLKDKDIIKMKSQEENARKELSELPSVKPQYTNEEIDHAKGKGTEKLQILSTSHEEKLKEKNIEEVPKVLIVCYLTICHHA